LMAEAYLRGEATPLDEQDVDELNGTLRAIDWLSAAPVHLPEADRVHQQIARARLVEPLEVLAGKDFVGRRAELRRLADYVGVPVDHTVRAVAQRLRHGLRRDQPVMLVHGPAGVGKSALVAHFILDHRAHLGWFAYLSLDRADLSAQQPLTLLAEAIRQLMVQYPAVTERAQDLERSVSSTVTSLALLEGDVGKAATASVDPAAWSTRDEHWHIGQFADLVEVATEGSQLPVLWVVDDLENAQREGPTTLDRLWRFVQELQSRLPQVRVVLVGAAAMPAYPVESLPLLAFDSEISAACVKQMSPELKVSDVLRVAADHSDQLTLKLAVEVLHRERPEQTSWSVERRESGVEPGSEDIRATLYRRILDHLADPELQALVYPSLALRRITPAVIKDVLAVPAGLHDIDDERARRLFESLEAEAFLVARIEGTDAVTHRADIRTSLLPVLQRDNPEVVATIHRRAVSFYRKIEGIEARTEELYHRLAMGQATETLDKYWDADAGRQLESALDELPPAARAYLADRLNQPVDSAT
ncbi:MAG: ATP-binding protein, partial [Jiangellaceae bacterium]